MKSKPTPKSEVEKMLVKHKVVAGAYGPGNGRIESNVRILGWAKELHAQATMGPRAAYNILQLLIDEYKVETAVPITYEMVRGWWYRQRGAK